ncbi:NAD(+) kinase [Gynuella sunshinyii]|uniref:NAD kinase n=1 Tax=Gynuella sunshinyii YC6258 TaxID=1445510 RepID=A0A0C5VY08_9GAMM|nr:NAD(+) kinase [Gynuella sunshinyii]AJQ95239.1 putative sugar kinase [Gynuella sunshinyii YC6258]
MSHFSRVGILGRLGNDNVLNTLKNLIQLLSDRQIPFKIEDLLKNTLRNEDVDYATRAELGAFADLIIVVGGDGTLLGAARDMAIYDLPVLGINRGRLGFLTDIMPDQMEMVVSDVFSGNFIEEQRFLLEVKVRRGGEWVGSSAAMNDIVLHPGQSIRMIEFELLIDGQFVYSQRSDGLIVSTPTGSTAYALSAGGPLMHPKLNAIVLVPMFPHTLTSRPLVVDGDAAVCVRIGYENDLAPQVSCDAQNHLVTLQGDELHISKMSHSLRLLHPKNYDYYEICRTKLGWGSRLGNDG